LEEAVSQLGELVKFLLRFRGGQQIASLTIVQRSDHALDIGPLLAFAGAGDRGRNENRPK